MLCGNCTVDQHAFTPYHKIQVRRCPGSVFVTTDTVYRGGQVPTSRSPVSENLGKRFNSATITGIHAPAHNGAPAPLQCYIRMEFTSSTSAFVPVTMPPIVAIALNNSYDFVYFLPQQRTLKPRRLLPSSNLHTFSVSNRSYPSMTFISLSRSSPMRHMFLMSRYALR